MKTITIITISLWLAALLPSVAQNFQIPATSNKTASKDLSNDSDGNYLISNANDLLAFANMVNSGQTDINGKLTADIFLNDTTGWQDWNSETQGLNIWNPIGNSNPDENQFTGTLDGQGHTIFGIFSNEGANYQGLVGSLGENGCICNLSLESGYLRNESSIGGLCASNQEGEIINCHNEITIEGKFDVGGICGINEGGKIIRCTNNGNVSGILNYMANNIGGICGTSNSGSFLQVYNTGIISGNIATGGICGLSNNDTLSECYNAGSINGDMAGGGFTGSLCAEFYSNLFNDCYWLEGTTSQAFGNTTYNGNEVVSKTREQFNSGEVAWLLQEVNTEHVWGQDLSSDPYPVLGGIKVYKNDDGTYSNSGTGSPDTIYLISNSEDLQAFANMVNSGQTDINGKLTADIFLNDTTGWKNWNSETQGLNQWIPIGSTEDMPFVGTLDGQGHTIYGLFSCDQDQKNHGLVGILGQSGSIRNINLMAGYLNGETAGGLCVQNYGGEIAHCHNHLTIEGEAVGGICAGVYNKGVIVNCYNNASIKGDLTSGGICAYARNGSLSNCYNTGTLKNNGFYTGSLAGRSDSSTFTQCYWMEGSARLAIGINQNPSYDTIAPNKPEQFRSGEIAYNLGDAWGQIIGSDHFPVWRTDNNKVYRHQLVNIEETDTLYANLVIKGLPEPTRTGYTFEGWFTDSIDGKEIRTNDTLEANSVLYAHWRANRYVITFLDEDSITLLQRDTLDYGQFPEFKGETPTKDATAEFSYTFAGWNPEIDTVTEDATYVATYTAQPRTYVLTLNITDTCEGMGIVNGDGTYPYGDTVIISATANEGYIFLNWNDSDINSTREIIITSDTTFTATFRKKEGSGTGVIQLPSEYPEFRVISLPMGLKIEGSNETAYIYDATGRLVYRGRERTIYVKSSGIYIVRIGKQIQRIMVL